MEGRAPVTVKGKLDHVTDEFIEEVIREVKKSFVSGWNLFQRSPFLQQEDSSFEWEASCIEGTQFKAGRGPRKPAEMKVFLQDTVFHPLFPVRQIVAFGSCLSNDPSIDGVDFCPYSIMDLGIGEIKITSSSGKYTVSSDGEQMCPGSVVESLLAVAHPQTGEVRELRVTLFGLQDNGSFSLAEGPQKSDELQKKALSDLVQRSFVEPMFVHCRSGYGRTGHFIAMAEIVKNYEKIFTSQGAIFVAQNILRLIKRIRRNRPYLLLVEEQLDNAIRNAKVLYQQGLNNQCVRVNNVLNTAYVTARLREVAGQTEQTVVEERKSTPSSSDQEVFNIYRTENAADATLPVLETSSSQTQTPTPQFSAPTRRMGQGS